VLAIRKEVVVYCVTLLSDLRDGLGMLQRLRRRGKTLKRDVVAVWLASRDPRVPWYVRAFAIALAAYALSPIDLIPDFVPVLGYVDDAIVLPLGILLIVRLIPREIMDEHRVSAARLADLPKSGTASVIIALVWLSITVVSAWFAYRYFFR
jgi:uncharacterized membrane protein YkvA (DUF1232 family)